MFKALEGFTFCALQQRPRRWRGFAFSSEEASGKLIYFANPDNPMGSWWDASYVESMIKSVPEGSADSR